MYACPWCQRKTFSFWQKQALGPSRSLRCTACTREVSVPWIRAQLAAAPLVLITFAGLVIGKVAYGVVPEILMGGCLGAMVGIIVTAPLYHFFVPLVKPQEP
jgi:hypothetical protein